jgi:hypothetical protein
VKEPEYILDVGTPVRIIDWFGVANFMVARASLDLRRRPAKSTDSTYCDGVIVGIVGGHGGDVYWVEHRDTFLVSESEALSKDYRGARGKIGELPVRALRFGEVAPYGWWEFELGWCEHEDCRQNVELAKACALGA